MSSISAGGSKMKKKVIMLSMLAITAAMLTACSDKNDAADVPEVSQAEESTENTDTDSSAEAAEESTENVEKDSEVKGSDYVMPEEYQNVLDKYKTMITEKWDVSKAFDEGMSSMVSEFCNMDAQDQIGYTLYDLDADGQPELLIGEMDTELPANRIIFDAYTLKDGNAVQIFESESRNRYYLVEDEAGAILIANEGSNGAASSGWLYYTVSGDRLTVQQAIMYDAAADEENPWFMAYDDDWDTSNDEPVDEDMAQSVINSYTDNYAKLDWTILVQE